MRKNKILVIFIILNLLVNIFSLIVFSDSNGIEINGDFGDWDNKPYVLDPKRDIISTWLNFLEVRYLADDEYLYLYVERESAKKSEPWDFEVIIINALTERNYVEQVPTEYLHYQVTNYERPISFAEMQYAKFSIKSDYDYNKSNEGIPINVIFEGNIIETTLSASNNNKFIEFKVPLSLVGLSGKNKEVKFMIKSAYDEAADNRNEYAYDWLPNGEAIIVTTGPTYWQFSSTLFFIAVTYFSYKITTNKNDIVFLNKKH